MPVSDIFSKRLKRLRGDTPDVYTYDDLPTPLRVQIAHIWKDTLGADNSDPHVNEAYRFIVDTLKREYGVFELVEREKHYQLTVRDELYHFFLNEKDVEKALDAVELSFKVINKETRNREYLGRHNASERADDAIEELNLRFKEHGVGYQFIPPHIIRIDSEFIHSEVVKPALKLLEQRHYAGAQMEFLKAHEHYRIGNAKEALSSCLNAFESVMKSICDKRGWPVNQNPTARHLIKACLDNGLIPSFWEQHYSSLRSLLESGVPTGRNKLSGHGQGMKPVSVPAHLTAYMMHMTASGIVFLADADKNLK